MNSTTPASATASDVSPSSTDSPGNILLKSHTGSDTNMSHLSNGNSLVSHRHCRHRHTDSIPCRHFRSGRAAPRMGSRTHRYARECESSASFIAVVSYSMIGRLTHRSSGSMEGFDDANIGDGVVGVSPDLLLGNVETGLDLMNGSCISIVLAKLRRECVA